MVSQSKCSHSKKDEWEHSRERSDRSKTQIREANAEHCRSIAGIWDSGWNYLCANSPGPPCFPSSATSVYLTSLWGQPHSVPAAFLSGCPMAPAFPVSWDLHSHLGFIFRAACNGLSGLPCKDSEVDLTNQSLFWRPVSSKVSGHGQNEAG